MDINPINPSSRQPISNQSKEPRETETSKDFSIKNLSEINREEIKEIEDLREKFIKAIDTTPQNEETISNIKEKLKEIIADLTKRIEADDPLRGNEARGWREVLDTNNNEDFLSSLTSAINIANA